MHAIAECSTRERRDQLGAVLETIRAWSNAQPSQVRMAYRWGIQQVERGLDERLAVFENMRAVKSAYETLPKPPQPED